MQNTTQNNITLTDNIRTVEFSLSITLIYLGFPLLRLETNSTTPSRTVFVFKYSAEIENAIDMYWNDGHLVEPKKFWGVARELKSRMRSTQYAGPQTS